MNFFSENQQAAVKKTLQFFHFLAILLNLATDCAARLSVTISNKPLPIAFTKLPSLSPTREGDKTTP
jgi:hypothetical protein